MSFVGKTLILAILAYGGISNAHTISENPKDSTSTYMLKNDTKSRLDYIDNEVKDNGSKIQTTINGTNMYIFELETNKYNAQRADNLLAVFEKDRKGYAYLRINNIEFFIKLKFFPTGDRTLTLIKHGYSLIENNKESGESEFGDFFQIDQSNNSNLEEMISDANSSFLE